MNKAVSIAFGLYGLTRKIAVAIVSLLVCLVAVDAQANKNFDPFGARGDHQNTDYCPHSGPAPFFLTGLNVRVGDWMDQMSIICAAVSPVDLSQGKNPGWYGPSRGGNGGAAPVDKNCGPNSVVVGVNLLMTPENRQVRMVQFTCSSIAGAQRHLLDIGNTSHGSPSNLRQDCPSGEAIQGITINWGKHVNAIGVRCVPLPKPAPVGGSADGKFCYTLAGKIVCNMRFVVNHCIKADLTKQISPCPPVEVGDGECTHFVQYMLKHAGALPPHFGDIKNKDYTWGTKLASLKDLKVGDVLQFWDAQFTSPDKRSSWGTGVSSNPNAPNHHTAIYAGMQNGMAVLYEQNVNKVRKVMRNTYHLDWPHTGEVIAFRPRPDYRNRH